MPRNVRLPRKMQKQCHQRMRANQAARTVVLGSGRVRSAGSNADVAHFLADRLGQGAGSSLSRRRGRTAQRSRARARAALRRRQDVLVRAQQIRRIPRRLDLGQARVVRPIRRSRALVAVVFGQEVHVGAAGRVLAQVAPGAARPVDVLAVVVGALPRAADVEDRDRVAVADGRVVLGQPADRAAEREDQNRRVRRDDPPACSIACANSPGSKPRRYSDFQ